jgi:hypothetical protein
MHIFVHACMHLQLTERIRLSTVQEAMVGQSQWNTHGALGLAPSTQAFLHSTLKSVQRSGVTDTKRFVPPTRSAPNTAHYRMEAPLQQGGVLAATPTTMAREHNVNVLKANVKMACAHRLAEKKSSVSPSAAAGHRQRCA